jgi:2'-5' RNA ligase
MARRRHLEPTVRVFLAVPPGERFSATLSARLDGVRDHLPVRWTRPHAWHLTLQFLGEWPQERLATLQNALATFAPGPPFRLRPAGPGAFPNLRRPRVLFLHLQDDGLAAHLASRLRVLVDEIWPDGPQDRKEFRPHLTLARVDRSLGRDQVKIFENMDLGGLPEISVEGFSLVASDLGPGGARYRDLAFVRMRKKGE